MNTYKIGNKGSCLIKAYSPCQIGNELMLYDGQPYTIIDNCTINMTFQTKEEDSLSTTVRLRDSRSFLKEIRISDCLITSKILNLIFQKIDKKLAFNWEKVVSDSRNKIFLNTNEEKIYQVFIYHNGVLESAYGELDITEGITVDNEDEKYLVSYGTLSESARVHSLNAMNNIYLSLDINLIGNTDDNTTDMKIHVDKCSLSVNKNMSFGGNINDVDLIFTVMNDLNEENYIVI